MARRGALGVLAAGLAAALGGCSFFGSSRYRFKITVEVITPQGLKSGSSVSQVDAFSGSDLMTGGKTSDTKVIAEAVAVDLPGQKTLFALLKTVNISGHDDFASMSMRTLDPVFDYDWVESAKRIEAGDSVRSVAPVSPSDYPLLVTFGDPRDPKSVMRVDPANLAASFGEGVRLKAILIELTDSSVTTGIQRRLSWLGAYPEPRLDNDFAPTTNPTFAQQIRHGDFQRGTIPNG